ncbi:30876_t:CDS:1, partial [Gigaspora margarita]
LLPKAMRRIKILDSIVELVEDIFTGRENTTIFNLELTSIYEVQDE